LERHCIGIIVVIPLGISERNIISGRTLPWLDCEKVVGNHWSMFLSINAETAEAEGICKFLPEWSQEFLSTSLEKHLITVQPAKTVDIWKV
jgi:hypothetical protein